MNRQEFISACISMFEMNAMACTEAQAQKLFDLTERMLEVNKSMNLTAIKEENAIILRHYVDSLTISDKIPENSRLIDVGCGAGFPSLPLAIFRPDLTIVALDGTAKRIKYVNDTAQLLGLSNLTAIAARAEELAFDGEYREKFDIATARAVAALPVLCELCLPYVAVGGKMIAMKSQQADGELAASKNCISLCGGAVTAVEQKDLTPNGVDIEQRTLIVIEKCKKTPNLYPRHFSKISKKPL